LVVKIYNRLAEGPPYAESLEKKDKKLRRPRIHGTNLSTIQIRETHAESTYAKGKPKRGNDTGDGIGVKNEGQNDTGGHCKPKLNNRLIYAQPTTYGTGAGPKWKREGKGMLKNKNTRTKTVTQGKEGSPSCPEAVIEEQNAGDWDQKNWQRKDHWTMRPCDAEVDTTHRT